MLNTVTLLVLGATAMFVSGCAIGASADRPNAPVAGLTMFLIACGILATAIAPLVH